MEFAQRGHLLAQTLASQNSLALLMQDEEGSIRRWSRRRPRATPSRAPSSIRKTVP
ncbi:hypothetical protein [Rhodothermus marinus]|uniref:hypothetical protein n=1 Tax=Rhodothermus marinus TaxID=29549 RepID=UPI001FB3EC76|nr:hypothetical protein [Rhodothermus marinus]